MARFTYRKVDRNRFTKVYPYVRFPPRIAFQFDELPGDSAVEAGKVTFTDSDSEIYTFVGTYSTAPSVIVSTVDSSASNNTNVSITITSISTTSATITSSSPFTGQVHIHVAAV